MELSLLELSGILNSLTIKNEKFNEREVEYINIMLGKEGFHQTDKGQKLLKRIVLQSIAEKIEKGETVNQDHFVLDLMKKENASLRIISEMLKKDTSLKKLLLSIDGKSMKLIHPSISSNKGIKKLKILHIWDDIAAYFLSKALNENDTIESITISKIFFFFFLF